MVHEQKFKDSLSSTCQVSPERIVLDLESEVNHRPGFYPTRGNVLKSFITNLHKIARSDRIGFMTKNPNLTIVSVNQDDIWSSWFLVPPCLVSGSATVHIESTSITAGDLYSIISSFQCSFQENLTGL